MRHSVDLFSDKKMLLDDDLEPDEKIKETAERSLAERGRRITLRIADDVVLGRDVRIADFVNSTAATSGTRRGSAHSWRSRRTP